MAIFAVSFAGNAFGQGSGNQDRGRDQAAMRDRTSDPTAAQDRIQDRTSDRDRMQDRSADRDRAQDREHMTTQERDRLREELHLQDRDQYRAGDIYGSDLMTRRERNEYRERLREMNSAAEWARFRAEHQEQMMARARERSADLQAPYYGQQLMTDQERLRLRERLENAQNEQERERIRNEHREEMQARARLHQIPLSEIE